ncbi:hypothetical protein FJU11_06120 [Pararhizobium mangrovi]|uniref:Transposase n=1 Tax=Pararhizobium mangrovi TaxID=2590452 RepID=A0A506U8T0_9HYPH|nr:hypothetical protein FJU11_06120 [Pararhizobium mangrovi]
MRYGFRAIGGRERAEREAQAEEIVGKLRRVDVLVSQGRSVSEAARAIGSPGHFFCWSGRTGSSLSSTKGAPQSALQAIRMPSRRWKA